MSSSVTKLKQLLFENEAETLAVLSRRVEAAAQSNHELGDELRLAIEELRAKGSEADEQLLERIEALNARTGSAEAMTHSVAEVLDRAFTDAERDRHDSLASAVAPVVVRTVKTEIRNSQDELVEALYPMTGQMVKAYVTSAMRDLVNEVNRRLENHAFMLRIKSLTTGRPVAELAIAESQRLAVTELLLVDRASGALIARWPKSPGSSHDHVFGGVLTAINSFATEALEGEETTLRQIDLGSSQVYLRGSPSYLLAARCSGTAHAAVERILDEEFLETVARLGKLEPTSRELASDAEIATSAERITERIAQKQSELSAPALGVSPVKLLVWVIGLPLIAWLGWSTWVAMETRRVQATATQIIRTSPEVKGYPTTLSISERGRHLRLSGLAPSVQAVAAVADRLASALPGTEIDNQLVVLPNSAANAEQRIVELQRALDALRADVPRQMAARALSRAADQLALTPSQLKRLASASEKLKTPPPQNSLSDAAAAASGSLTAVNGARTALLARDHGDADAKRLIETLDAQSGALAAARNRLLQDLGGLATAASPQGPQSRPTQSHDVLAASEAIAVEAQALNTAAIALLQGVTARAAIPLPKPPAEPTPIERLSAFARTNAIFFGNESDYRDAVVAETALDTAAALIKETGVLIRVVGYTDERGTIGRNVSLSQARAEKVRDALAARGVPEGRLVAIGRQAARDISPRTGADSPNRRVEFEIGFAGEATP